MTPDPRMERCANCHHLAGEHSDGGGTCRHPDWDEITVHPYDAEPRTVPLFPRWCECERVVLA